MTTSHLPFTQLSDHNTKLSSNPDLECVSEVFSTKEKEINCYHTVSVIVRCICIYINHFKTQDGAVCFTAFSLYKGVKSLHFLVRENHLYHQTALLAVSVAGCLGVIGTNKYIFFHLSC